MNQADFWVTPKVRANSQELTPLREFASSQKATIHLSKVTAESSITVPTLTVNCR